MTKEQLTEFQESFAASMEQWFDMTLAFDIGQEQSGITPNEYKDEQIMFVTKILGHVIMNKAFFLEGDFKEKCDKMENFGKELRELVKKYTDKDTHELVNK